MNDHGKIGSLNTREGFRDLVRGGDGGKHVQVNVFICRSRECVKHGFSRSTLFKITNGFPPLPSFYLSLSLSFSSFVGTMDTSVADSGTSSQHETAIYYRRQRLCSRPDNGCKCALLMAVEDNARSRLNVRRASDA